METTAPATPAKLSSKPGAWVDLALTLPIFVVYHVGVIFLNVHNAADYLTFELFHFAENSKSLYILFTLAIGVVFTGVFAWLGRGEAFRPYKFVQIALEGVIYAFVMRLVGAYVVGHLFAGSSAIAQQGTFTGIIMSMGAGFYEELAFRVILFGGGAAILSWLLTDTAAPPSAGRTTKMFLYKLGWALVVACIFSFVHYTGSLGDKFDLRSFVFRAVLGLALTAIYASRGFAAAVWAHTAYDVWVLVL